MSQRLWRPPLETLRLVCLATDGCQSYGRSVVGVRTNGSEKYAPANLLNARIANAAFRRNTRPADARQPHPEVLRLWTRTQPMHRARVRDFQAGAGDGEIPIADGRGHLRLKRMEGPWRRTFHSRGGGVVPRSGIEPTRFLIRTHGVSLPSGSTRQRWGPSRRQQLAGPFRKTPMGSRVTRACQGEIARIIEGNTRSVVGGLPPERAVFRCVGHSFRECSFMGRDPTRRCADRPDAVDASSGLLPWIPMISRVAVSRRRDP